MSIVTPHQDPITLYIQVPYTHGLRCHSGQHIGLTDPDWTESTVQSHATAAPPVHPQHHRKISTNPTMYEIVGLLDAQH
jgi:hypothetical protein